MGRALGAGARPKSTSLVKPVVVGGEELDWYKKKESLVVRFVLGNTAGEFKTFCTGYLMDQKSVLTAGHCFIGPVANEFHSGNVYVEIFDPRNPNTPKRIRVQSHKSQFAGEGKLDLSMAHLSESAARDDAEFVPIVTGECEKGRAL